MFDQFGDYMYSLLTAPMRQVKKSANQFYIFFKAVGALFDDCKQKLFALREASMIVSAPDVMLSVHGEERGLNRLSGEALDTYRLRLSLYTEVAKTAGTNVGILMALESFGYEHGAVEPMSHYDQSRWAEFIISLGHGTPQAYRELPILYQEIQKVKPAGSKLAYFVYVDNAPLDISLRMGTVVTGYAERVLNTSASLLLIRDRAFNLTIFAGMSVSSYTETVLVRSDELLLVRDRIINTKIRFAPAITSYKKERLL